ncbi:plantaricin C family lantibiotic [Amphibacillus sp. MSJ-3]|uniref:plantaricin C family lantibiotic n=1 Tax=Amphibacillus sp. MSJ-3 TaxID=2841505 RepID=UPI0035301B75
MVETWKNPLSRMEHQVESPVGNVIDELSDSEMEMIAGACKWYNISCRLGNKGGWCTLTVECQRSCN